MPGHILGSVGVTIEAEGKKIFYTGDVNFEHSTLQKGALFPEEHVDALIVETTRGEQARDPGLRPRRTRKTRFAEAIKNVIERKGSVLIPVFAMGKTQEVLGMIHRFKKEGLIPKHTPVYIGGLSTKMTQVYDRFSDDLAPPPAEFPLPQGHGTRGRQQEAQGPDPLPPRLHLRAFQRHDVGENRFQQFRPPGSSGKPEARPVLRRLRGSRDARRQDPRRAKPGDIDRARPRLSAGAAELRDADLRFQRPLHPRRHRSTTSSRSAPKKTFLVHGDDGAVEWFRQEIKRRLPDTEVIVPEPGVEYEI